ncbi:hypothetical protein FM114_04180 [Luteococcus japonicus LSP_Lj1]|uniref:Uncharacterized protein n=1 Tax=Luteococcus japonicus LSP_Lj1 TaxID=1255658 RepID=A0A1R4IWJ6_9ACTN|nr:hypothetical protein FM114_04180 [Luteococcus japonicus LSP_Lj1]
MRVMAHQPGATSASSRALVPATTPARHVHHRPTSPENSPTRNRRTPLRQVNSGRAS